MRRRTFLAAAGALLTAPTGALGLQPERIARVGRLSPLSETTEVPMLGGLRRGLQDLGWIEGRNLTFVVRFADGRLDRLPELAADLVDQKLDVIVTGSTPGALAAIRATRTIPIVMVTTGDPVEAGLVASLARPGGNVTGIAAMGQTLNAKRLEILKEAVPGLKRVSVLINPDSQYGRSFLRARGSVAKALEIEIGVAEVREPGELEAAFADIRTRGSGALMVVTEVMFVTQRRRIVELATRYRLPTAFGERESVQQGGLLFYGASLPNMYRRAAIHVDRILKGANPADLPVEQPIAFELVINLKAASALGVAVPSVLLARADEVIE